MKVYLGTDSKRPIEALGQVGGENNLKYLERLSLKRCGNSNANTSAIGVLGYVGNKETIERLKVLAGQYPEQVSVAIKRIEQKIKNEK